MTTLEQYFSSATLQVSIPDASVEFPPSSPPDEWLSRLRESTAERKLAFFDEQMSYFLILQVDEPGAADTDSSNPPSTLLQFLAHLQISMEAMFISSIPIVVTEASPASSVFLSAPPRTAASRLNPRSAASRHHPSIFPPATPNPMPAVAQNDRQYLNADGTILFSGIWGQDASEAFTLFWSEESKAWIAVFKLALAVAYTRLTYSNPLLCVTVAATLREKPLSLTQPKSPLRSYLMSYPEFSTFASTPTSADGSMKPDTQDLEGFEEVNLLEGLAAGPSFHPSSIYLPSSRLGSDSRRELFALPPIKPTSPTTPSPSPLTAARTAHPTLRKAFRKTLHVVSGIQMRMRTTFVPAVILPEHANNEQEERDLRESGNEERTVVLCLEVENPDQSNGMDFIVEDVQINIGDEGAKSTLIGWGESIIDSPVFPLQIGPQGQCNLLYALSFLQSPDESDGLLSVGGRSQDPSDLRRMVNINIIGKPAPRLGADPTFPTGSFISKWNTVLNLSPRRPQVEDQAATEHEVLPEPPSPFPVTAVTVMSSVPPRRSSVVAGSGRDSPSLLGAQKRHTLPGSALTGSGLFPLKPPTPIIHPGRSSVGASSSLRTPYSPLPPSAQFPKTPTTYEPPPATPLPYDTRDTLPEPPMTPAYPAYPHTPGYPSSPPSQFPDTTQSSSTYVGPSVEMRRDRGSVPMTPMAMGFGEEEERVDEPVVVSIGVLEDQEGDFKISLHGVFTLDIFVYNRSGRTRRLEISYPDRRTQRRKGEAAEKGDGPAGVLPLDNRVRIGPLLPTACQSVRMRFMALMPGVQSIDTLILTDIESQYSTSLRSVMDIVVHE